MDESKRPPRASSAKAEDATTRLPDGPVLVFDGMCNLCNGSIKFVIDHERAPDLRFVAVQTDIGQELLERAFGAEQATHLVRGATGDGDPDSVVLVEGTRGWTHSDAGLRVARHLRAPYRWLAVFGVVPRPVRDLVYRWIARNRYRWFGKTDTCRIPTPELRARFLA